MRATLLILIGIHAVIHLFGFLKAFGIAKFNAISRPIQKTFGVVWLLTFLLFIITLILVLIQSNYWWITGATGMIISQVLIITNWKDAKFGTVLNLIILVATIIGYSTFMFNEKVNEETSKIISQSTSTNKVIISKQMISDLPTIVQKWLLNSGAMGKEIVNNIYLEQDLEMLMKPDQKNWSSAKAKQYFTTEPPAFNWSVSLKMNPFLYMVGRDKFEDGQGEMTIKLFSILPIVNVKNEEKVNQATLQRYLAEIVWFPSASLSPYITWEPINPNCARATMTYNKTSGSGIFYFDKDGCFEKFVAMRFKDAKDIKPTEWTVSATKTEERNGIKIPVECEVDWKLDTTNWTWLKLKITNIKYNINN